MISSRQIHRMRCGRVDGFSFRGGPSQAGDAGFVMSLTQLGTIYLQGQVVVRDPIAAAGFFERATQRGDATAQNELGLLYRYGTGVAQDYAKARALFQKAAEQNLADA